MFDVLWPLGAYIDYSEHVLESHVGEKEKERSIHVHDSVLIVFLTVEDNANEQCNHLRGKCA
jgi:hypothetical protein